MTNLELNQFTGTESYYRFSRLLKNTVLTDGTKYLAEKAGAYWLMDEIGLAHKLNRYVATQKFTVWTLTKNKTGRGAKLVCDDGNGNVVYSKRIQFTDFPLPEIKLYAGVEESIGQGGLVIFLPSEY